MEKHSVHISGDILKKYFPFFEPELIQELSKYGEWVSVDEGEQMMQAGDYIKSFPIVLDGRMKVFREDESGKEMLLYYLNRGQVCAMALTCCMGHSKSTINAIADNDVDLIRLPVEMLDELMIKYPTWKSFVMNSYHQRFEELLEVVNGIAFKKMDQRLIDYLKKRNEQTGETVFEGTHSEIANDLATSREVISRLLKSLEKDNLVILSRNKIDFTTLLET